MDLGKEFNSAPSGPSYEAGTTQFMEAEVPEDKAHMYRNILSDGMITTSDKSIFGPEHS